jgi:hypothetical protein
MARRTAGMTVIGALSILLGLFGLVNSWMMLRTGLGQAAPMASSLGISSGPLVVCFAVARAIVSLILIVSGMGVLRVAASARPMSLSLAAIWILLNAIEPAALHYSYLRVVFTTLYPIVLLIVFSLPGWKLAFAPGAPPTEGDQAA